MGQTKPLFASVKILYIQNIYLLCGKKLTEHDCLVGVPHPISLMPISTKFYL